MARRTNMRGWTRLALTSFCFFASASASEAAAGAPGVRLSGFWEGVRSHSLQALPSATGPGGEEGVAAGLALRLIEGVQGRPGCAAADSPPSSRLRELSPPSSALTRETSGVLLAHVPRGEVAMLFVGPPTPPGVSRLRR